MSAFIVSVLKKILITPPFFLTKSHPRAEAWGWSVSHKIRVSNDVSKKIWDVRAHVSKLLAYVANKHKTVMEIENKNFDKAERLAAEILGLPYTTLRVDDIHGFAVVLFGGA